jgi:hypothetical protein
MLAEARRRSPLLVLGDMRDLPVPGTEDGG